MCVCAPVLMARAGYLAFLGSHSLPGLTPLLPLVAGVRGPRVPPAGLGLVSYPLRDVLCSRRCGCSLALVLYLLVPVLGIVVFVVFSKICMFLGGDAHCPTHATILALPVFLVF